MTVHSDIDSRNSDSVSDYLDHKIRRKRNLIKKKTKKIKAVRRKNTKRTKSRESKKMKKDLKKLKRNKFMMTSRECLAIIITDRVRKKLSM
jgi:L-fucose mutarotase/ribose pyranase (RbsD/FucU family)